MEQKFQHNPQWNGKISWTNSAFIVLTPLLALLMLPYMVLQYGVTWADFGIFTFMILSCGLSLTAGYHRMFSHQAFEVRTWVKAIFLFFGAGCVENSALKWSSDHRYHHRFVDKDGDPYNINRGFFYAHMGWIFFQDPPERTLTNAPDLVNDPWVAFQHKHYVAICALMGFGLPALIGAYFGRPLAGFFWGGLFRVVFTHHLSFLINSACHMFGSRPYSTKVTARDCWWLAILTNGEGYHNFHHTFGGDFRNGHLWYHFDLSKWFILGLQSLGLAYNLKRTPDAIVLKAQLETSYEKFRAHWDKPEVPAQLSEMRATLETKIQELQLKFREFQAWKESKVAEHSRTNRARARLWKRRLNRERQALEASVREFTLILRSLEMQGSLPRI